MRNLVIVLGDQLNRDSAAFDQFDPNHDVVWMAEAAEESQHVWSHKARIALFLSAMRHFREQLGGEGICVEYHRLEHAHTRPTLREQLAESIRSFVPEKLVVVEPGEWRIQEMLRSIAAEYALPLDTRGDRTFYCSRQDFAAYAEGRKLRLEYFYREMRRRNSVLTEGAHPAGGRWNFDPENRRSFGKQGPSRVPPPKRFPPDSITRAVIQVVEDRFSHHPGDLRDFSWPVTPEQAHATLDDWIMNRLPLFGAYQDAMWTSQPFLYHAMLSAAMNLKLLSPRDVVASAEMAFHDGYAPLASVEGFIRQVIGWREYVHGVYWLLMPDYLDRNTLDAAEPLPDFYWTGDTEMNCLREVIQQTLRYGYAHHIQRLMVTGLYALLLGVNPVAVHEWYLAIYVDAVEWVELPNTLGMSQYADDGVMASKPYIASGRYINRMSNYCGQCRFKPEESTGPDACPFTTLYWDFLMRHHDLLAGNRRTQMQVRNLARLSGPLKIAVQKRAEEIRAAKGQAPSRAC